MFTFWASFKMFKFGALNLLLIVLKAVSMEHFCNDLNYGTFLPEIKNTSS